MLRRKILSEPASQKPGYRAELLDLLTEIGQQVESTVVIDRETGLASTGFFARSDVNAYSSIKLTLSAYRACCALS